MPARPFDRDADARSASANVDGRKPSALAEAATCTASHRSHRRRRALKISAVALAVTAAALAWCEHAGWPFVAEPAQRWLSSTLGRQIRFADPAQSIGWNGRTDVSLHLLGGIRLRAQQLTIDNATWAPTAAGPMVDGRELAIDLAWRELLAWRPGQTLPLRRVEADALRLDLRRRTAGDGAIEVNWALGRMESPSEPSAGPAIDGVRVARMAVSDGHLVYDDTPLDLQARGDFGVRESQAQLGGNASSSTAPDSAARASSPTPRHDTRATIPAASDAAPDGLHADLQGRYQGHPLTLTLRTGSTRPWWDASATDTAVEVRLSARAGPARLDFDGHVLDGLNRLGLQGRYRIAGRSLAAIGEPLGVVLPTTGAVRLDGHLQRNGLRWHTVVSDARIGSSRLSAELTFVQADEAARRVARAREAAQASGADPAQAAASAASALPSADRTQAAASEVPGERPRLTGRVAASRLLLADLGPTIGGAPPEAADTPPGQRVLPDRKLDIPSLRAMDADVRFDARELDTGTPVLQEIRPAQARLLLRSGVLTVSDIDARAARGRLSGDIRLDGRRDNPAWRARLALQGLDLAQWVRPLQRAEGPPWAAGRVDARVWLDGRGRSVAEVLGAADGQAALLWREGQISHLAVEAAGIDLAQGLGVLLFKRNENLAVNCGIARLEVRNGVFTPDPLVVDTRDTRLRVDGSGKLGDETLDLRLVARPKDFSPLALRSPVHVAGRFNAPRISVESGPIATRLLAAAAAAVAVAPVAALLPLMDLPDAKAQAPQACDLPALVLQR